MTSYFKIGSNMRERNSCVPDDGVAYSRRVDILYSYDTPVAMYDRVDRILYITDEYHSATTNRHINKWTDGTTRFMGEVRDVMSQDDLWKVHHRVNLFEAQQAGVTE